MGSRDNPGVLAQDLSLGGNDNPVRVNPQADQPVGEGSRYAVTVAFKVNQAGRRYPLGVVDEAVEGPAWRHQAGHLAGPDIGDRARQATMRDMPPLRDAALLEPGIERVQIGEAGQRLPQPAPGILYVLLDLSLLPARGRIAELRREQVVARHRGKPGVDLPGLARSDPVDRGLHVVEDPAPRHTAQDPERLGQRIEQHLVGLEEVSAHDECPAVRQLGMRNLQPGALTAEDRPVLAPVELEGLARRKHQRHEGATTAGLLLVLPIQIGRAHV